MEAPASLWAPEWRHLTIGLVLTVTLVASEALAVATVLPLVARDLQGLSLYGWVTSAFFLGTLVGIVVGGEQVDRRGPAAPFAAALVVFSAGLLAAGLAPAMWVVVVGRALQGVGAGAIPAVSYATIGRTIPHALRPRVFALLSTAWVVPGLAGPGLAAVVATAAGWRAVFLGLVPIVAITAIVPFRALRSLGAPPGSAVAASRLVPALRVAIGAGLALAALAERSLLAVPLAACAAAVAARPLAGLLPRGTLIAGPGLPAAVLARGLLTFAFFGADTFVPLALVSVRHRSTALAGIALTAATLAWTAASWIQQRLVRRTSPRLLVGGGFCIVAAGIAGAAAALSPSTPAELAAVAWAVAGFGIGLAYSTLSLAVLREAPAGQEGTATSALQLSDNLGVALGAGLGGTAVALGAAAGQKAEGIAVAYAIAAAAAVVGIGVARRLLPELLGSTAPR